MARYWPNPTRCAALAAALALTLACGAGETPPEHAALAFWEAIRDADFEEALRHSDVSDAEELERFFGGRLPTEVSFGETLRSDTHARVETVVGDTEDTLRFDTRLTRSDAGWRVAAEDTAEELRRASWNGAVDSVAEAIEEGRRVLGDALERGAREASDALRRAQEALDDAYPPGGDGPNFPNYRPKGR